MIYGLTNITEVKQTDLLLTDRAGEEYFIEEARDFTQNTGGAKKESAFQKISFPVLERMKERMHKKLCKGAERKSHRGTSHKNSVGSSICEYALCYNRDAAY